MPAILAALLVIVRTVMFSDLWSVRIAIWRYAKIMGPVTNVWWRPTARVLGYLGRRFNISPLDETARFMGDAIRRIEMYEDALHRELTRRHLWRPLFAASTFHDVRSYYVRTRDAQHHGKDHVEFESAEGHRSFWAERRRRAPSHVFGGAGYRQRFRRPAIV